MPRNLNQFLDRVSSALTRAGIPARVQGDKITTDPQHYAIVQSVIANHLFADCMIQEHRHDVYRSQIHNAQPTD